MRTLADAPPEMVIPDRMVWIVYGDRPVDQVDFLRNRAQPPVLDILVITDGRVWSTLQHNQTWCPSSGFIL